MTQKANKNQNTLVQAPAAEFVSSRMGQDLKTSVLIVSILVNMVILITWITLQVTTKYDAQLSSFLFTR